MARRLAEICLATWPDSDEILAASAESSFHLERILSHHSMPDLELADDSSLSTDSEFESISQVSSDAEEGDSELSVVYDPDLALNGDEDAPESQKTEEGFDDDEENEEDLHNCALAASKWTWPAGVRPRVLCMDPPPGLSKKVRDLVGIWEQHASIRFDFVNSAPAEIRISFTQGIGSFSKLGRLAELVTDQSRATMNLEVNEYTPADRLRRAVLHEFGHALGLIHEHSSPKAEIPWNKSAVYARCMPAGWNKQKVKMQIFKKYDHSELSQYSEFDRHSIMIYAISRKLTDGKFEVAWNSELSAMDKKFVAKLYPPPPAGESALTTSSVRGAPATAGAAAMTSAIPIRSTPPAPRPTPMTPMGLLTGKYCDNPKCPFEEPCERDWDVLMTRHGNKSSGRRARG